MKYRNVNDSRLWPRPLWASDPTVQDGHNLASFRMTLHQSSIFTCPGSYNIISHITWYINIISYPISYHLWQVAPQTCSTETCFASFVPGRFETPRWDLVVWRWNMVSGSGSEVIAANFWMEDVVCNQAKPCKTGINQCAIYPLYTIIYIYI